MSIKTLKLNRQQDEKILYFFDKKSSLVFFSLTDIGVVYNKSAKTYIRLFSLSDSPKVLIKDNDVFASTDKAIDFIEWNGCHDRGLELIKEILIITQNFKER